MGFIINREKSVLKPTHEITFLGFVLNSVQMTVSIPKQKCDKIVASIAKLIHNPSPKIRDVARVIGLLVSCELAVPYGPLFRRSVENSKNQALAQNGADLEAHMTPSEQAISDLKWWISNLRTSSS